MCSSISRCDVTPRAIRPCASLFFFKNNSCGEHAAELLRHAAWAYREAAHEDALNRLPLPQDAAERLIDNLYWPKKNMTPRRNIPLDGTWRFAPDILGHGEALGFCIPGYDDRAWIKAPVPSCFETACPDLEFHEGICWYRRAFRIPRAWKKQRVVLRFEGVNFRARVWLNGRLLGVNHDGCLPFEFEIHNRLLKGRNILAVEVDNRHHEGDLPGMHVGWRRFGGILREVSLYSTDLCHVEQAHVSAVPSGSRGDLLLRVKARNTLPRVAKLSLEATVLDKKKRILATLRSKPRVVAAGSMETFEIEGGLARVRPWSPSTPVLYRAAVRLLANGRPMDETEVSFGFRRIERDRNGLLLNGRRIFLKGFNRHEDSPRTGMAADHDLTRQDIIEMKKAGANFMRLCHYPHHPKTLDICDELGLLAFAELPLYFWNDRDEGLRTNTARVAAAARQLKSMIARDFNHPSVIFWSVSNETHEQEASVWRSNAELVRLARRLDPTRLCVHVSCHWKSHPHFEEDDVACVNHYPSLALAYNAPLTAKNLRAAADDWRNSLAKLRKQYPEKPILVTEFGFASVADANGHSLDDDAHARALVAEYAALHAPYVCGATIWCWADHAWPPGRFMGGIGVSPYGIVRRNRRKKTEPYRAVRAMFAASAPRGRNASAKH